MELLKYDFLQKTFIQVFRRYVRFMYWHLESQHALWHHIPVTKPTKGITVENNITFSADVRSWHFLPNKQKRRRQREAIFFPHLISHKQK